MNKTILDISAEIGSGITPLRSNPAYWASRDFPWVKTEQLGEYQVFDANEYISQIALEETTIKLWPPKTVSVAMYGEGKTRGNTSILMMRSTTNQACCNIVADPQKADYRFLYYWLKNNYEQLRMLAAGVRKNLNADDIKGFPFPDFSVPYQTEIADVLSAIDDLIQNNNCICTELEAMAKTLYDYWFTQFDFPNAEGKPYHSSGGAMEWNDQLKREIPKGWKVCAIGNLLSKVPNTTRIQTGEYLKTGRIPVIDQSTDYIAGYTNDENAALASAGGYVVFGDHTRIVKYIRFPFARGADGTQVLKSNTSCVPDELLYQIVKSVDLSNYGYARHFKFLKDTLAIVPNETIAKEYAHIVASIHDKQVQLTFENVELTELRDWLLPMLMNGQATVE